MFNLCRCYATASLQITQRRASRRSIVGGSRRSFHATAFFRNDTSTSNNNMTDQPCNTTTMHLKSSSSSLSFAPPVSNLFLYDSLSQSIKAIPVMNEDQTKALAWYTCGPTTYSAMHLGHARTYVWLDMMRRVLEFVAASQGAPPPLFVMNITDIDDKILAAATTATIAQQSPMVISRRAEAAFWNDMDRLGCQRPHITTRVTEFVESDIIPYIERLVQQDMAYPANDGVYFDVKNFEDKVGLYGKLAGAAIQSSPTSSNVNNSSDVDPPMVEGSSNNNKRDQRDFALWKFRKPGENVYWLSPWGDGRPGWHIECSAMIEAVQKRFQDSHQFLVHAGGWDLKFPHHANEIAQAEAYHYDDKTGCAAAAAAAYIAIANNSTTSRGETNVQSKATTCHCPSDQHTCRNPEWIPLWVHTGHLMVKQTKMSKSLKNFLTVDELWFDYDPSSSSQLDSPADDFRLWCLMGGSYGRREEYSRSKILGARQNRGKILRFLMDGERWLDQCHREQAKSGCNLCDDTMSEKSTFDSTKYTSKRWTDSDHGFFITVNESSTSAYQALLNNMKGTKFVEGLLRIAEIGSAHIRHLQPSDGANVEPIKAALQHMRDLLSLVGFSDLTVRAGLLQRKICIPSSSAQEGGESPQETSSNYVAGGETAIIEELVRFRAAVREAALQDVKNKTGTENVKAILKACDEVRNSLPRIGVEVMDTNKETDATWRFCVPKEKKP